MPMSVTAPNGTRFRRDDDGTIKVEPPAPSQGVFTVNEIDLMWFIGTIIRDETIEQLNNMHPAELIRGHSTLLAALLERVESLETA